MTTDERKLLEAFAERINLFILHHYKDIDIDYCSPGSNYIFSSKCLPDSEDMVTVLNCRFTSEQVKLVKKYSSFFANLIPTTYGINNIKKVTEEEVRFKVHCGSER